jgi:hypothetical protein
LVERLRYPSYVRGVVAGVKDALERQDAAPIDWTKVLPALDLVSTDPWPVQAQTADPFDADRDWSGTQREAMRLLQSALKGNAPFDEDQLELIWTILTRLLVKGRSASSTIMEERPDLMMLAINKDSTVALQTLFELALNASRREMVGRWGDRLAVVVREQLEVSGAESRLSGAVAAGLLPQFVHVSGQAAVDLIPTLFGEPRPEEILIENLETMLKYSRPITNDLLVIFLPYLEVYFRAVPSSEGGAERSAVRWFLIGYIRGIEGLESPTQLLDVLEEPSRLSEAAEFYGRVLRESEAPVDLEDALRFWDAFLEMDPPPTAYRGFGWWSEGNAVPDSEWLERIVVTLTRTSGLIDWDHEVVERLCRLVEFESAWEALTFLVKGAPERWTVAHWAGRLLRLFEDTEGSPEPVSSARTELAEALLGREFLDFRRFIAAPVVDAPTFSEWGWTLRDPQKRALADSVRTSRATVDERYLTDARSAALQIVADNPNFGELLGKANASVGPDDWPDADAEAWNRETANDLRAAYEDVLMALIAGRNLGKGYRRVLAEPLLDKVPGLSGALGLE